MIRTWALDPDSPGVIPESAVYQLHEAGSHHPWKTEGMTFQVAVQHWGTDSAIVNLNFHT